MPLCYAIQLKQKIQDRNASSETENLLEHLLWLHLGIIDGQVSSLLQQILADVDAGRLSVSKRNITSQ